MHEGHVAVPAVEELDAAGHVQHAVGAGAGVGQVVERDALQGPLAEQLVPQDVAGARLVLVALGQALGVGQQQEAVVGGEDEASDAGVAQLAPGGDQVLQGPGELRGSSSAVASLVDVIALDRESVSAEVSVDQDRIHVNGESNGGLMTQRIAREATSLAASVGVVNAAQPANNDCGDPTGPIPIAFIVGTADETMPWDGGNAGPGEMLSAEDTLAYWHTLDGCSGDGATEALADLDQDDGSTVELQTWSCTEADVVRYVAEGGGHVPPSIDQQTSDTWDAFAGEQNHDLETAHALWAFFEAHPR